MLNDPTSEYLYDILATDGGTIDVLDAGAVVKMFPMNHMLLVFAPMVCGLSAVTRVSDLPLPTLR